MTGIRGHRQRTNTPTSGRVRSLVAESLTFGLAGVSSECGLEMRREDETIWLTQKMMATLFGVSVSAINQHLKRIFADGELTKEAAIKSFLIAHTEGHRTVRRAIKYFNFQALIAVGFKIENERAVQFRKWANQIIQEFAIQGWTMDVDRLKHGGHLTDAFFARQLEQLREIRLSERNVYQKITDIYATALDYDPTATVTKRVFKAVYLGMDRALKPDPAARTTGGATALGTFEHAQMQRVVSTYLDVAERQAIRKIPMTMEDWERRLTRILKLWDREILKDAARVSEELARIHGDSHSETFRSIPDRLTEQDFERVVEQTASVRAHSALDQPKRQT